ncbi:hypothetical protein AB0H42_33050 [Nocardia sp. NPDC050799]|uniref:hypothetical protein n=1 Tax=Nocardia sp. NPDC050799 TaxID=3154842 RepID=UPI0033CB86BB
MGPHATTVLISSGDDCAPFLPPEALMAAVQGHTETHSPMAVYARELAALYLRWIDAPPHQARTLHTQIGQRISAVDAWIHGLLPRPLGGVTPGTDSVGGVVARVAEAWACAHWTLHHDVDEVERHRAWDHLAEMHQGYAGLIRLVLNGLIILPKSWPGLGWAGVTNPALPTTPRESTADTRSGGKNT